MVNISEISVGSILVLNKYIIFAIIYSFIFLILSILVFLDNGSSWASN